MYLREAKIQVADVPVVVADQQAGIRRGSKANGHREDIRDFRLAENGPGIVRGVEGEAGVLRLQLEVAQLEFACEGGGNICQGPALEAKARVVKTGAQCEPKRVGIHLDAHAAKKPDFLVGAVIFQAQRNGLEVQGFEFERRGNRDREILQLATDQLDSGVGQVQMDAVPRGATAIEIQNPHACDEDMGLGRAGRPLVGQARAIDLEGHAVIIFFVVIFVGV